MGDLLAKSIAGHPWCVQRDDGRGASPSWCLGPESGSNDSDRFRRTSSGRIHWSAQSHFRGRIDLSMGECETAGGLNCEMGYAFSGQSGPFGRKPGSDEDARVSLSGGDARSSPESETLGLKEPRNGELGMTNSSARPRSQPHCRRIQWEANSRRYHCWKTLDSRRFGALSGPW